MKDYEEYSVFTDDPEFCELMRDDDFAAAFSSQIAQKDWYVWDWQEDGPKNVAGMSYRGAGSLVAEIRNDLYQTGETYMDYAWRGPEFGDEDLPTEKVLSLFERLGLYQLPPQNRRKTR